jgi:hypothetical protein
MKDKLKYQRNCEKRTINECGKLKREQIQTRTITINTFLNVS